MPEIFCGDKKNKKADWDERKKIKFEKLFFIFRQLNILRKKTNFFLFMTKNLFHERKFELR